jgi:hypothetical protein
MKPSKITKDEKCRALGQCYSQVVQSGFDTIWRDLDAVRIGASNAKFTITHAEAAIKYAAEKLVYLKTVMAFEQAKKTDFYECNGKNGEGSVNVPAPNQWRAETWVM